MSVMWLDRWNPDNVLFFQETGTGVWLTYFLNTVVGNLSAFLLGVDIDELHNEWARVQQATPGRTEYGDQSIMRMLECELDDETRFFVNPNIVVTIGNRSPHVAGKCRVQFTHVNHDGNLQENVDLTARRLSDNWGNTFRGKSS